MTQLLEIKPAHKRIADALDACPYKIDIITISMQGWWDYYRILDKKVRQSYNDNGFYRIPSRRFEYLSRDREQYEQSVKAITYRGIPVVIDEEYAELMRGKRSNRVVLGVE